MRIYTIGFAGKSAEEFFTLLMKNGIQRLVDVRLNNVSQMAAFTKKDDLKYFLCVIAGIDYVHLPIFAPTKEILEDYRKDKSWERFEERFKKLIEEVRPIEKIDAALFTEKICCLLCSEPEAEHCHRRLVAEYLSKHSSEPVEIVHI
ncbi:MAG: DUF488 domain-containing protein [Candidatus Lindowbacteria bacterium]|nr:DUF488 domain-containing protein [Candidatus Lindowbacteria bacterium]